jgi:threonine/homoserine/homoserine lactone efflux protein
MHAISTAGLWTGFATVIGVWVVTVVTPGPNFLATVHATLTRSRRAGLLVASVAGIAGLWYGAVAWAMAADPVVTLYRTAARAISALAGVVFVALGLRLAAER